jgi:hypothetical protein
MDQTFESLVRRLTPGDRIEVTWGKGRRPKEAYPTKGVVTWIGSRFIVYQTPKGWRSTVSKGDLVSEGAMVVVKK